MTVSAPARPRSGTRDRDGFLAFLDMRPKEQCRHLIEDIAVMMGPPGVAPRRFPLDRCELLDRELTGRRRTPGDLYRGTPLRAQQRRGE